MINRLYNYLKLCDDNNIHYNYDAAEKVSDKYGYFYDAFVITMSMLSCIVSIICTIRIFG